jgi:ethanolamine utilization protein EutM
MDQALGMIETRGLAAAVAAADAAVKAAGVQLEQRQRSGGALVCVLLRGEVAAVEAALAAGAAAAERVGRVLSVHLIARPDAAAEPVWSRRAGPGLGLRRGRGRGRKRAGGKPGGRKKS